MKTNRYCRIKKVITSKGNIQYFIGDGLWFGRIGAAAAELGLATEQYKLWEVVSHAKMQIVK